MKNFIIAILLVLLIALGVFVVKREGIGSVKELANSIEASVDKTVESVKSQVAAVSAPSSENIPASLVSLPGDTVFSLVFPGKAIAPAITHLSNFVVKVKSSSLGKKLEIDKMIDQGIEAAKAGATGAPPEGFSPPDGFGGDPNGLGQDFGGDIPPSGAHPAASAQPSIEEVLKTIDNFEKLEVLLRAKTLEGKATPLLKVSASFKDDAYSKQLQATLDGFVEMSQMGGGPQLKKDEKDPQTYVLNVKPPMAPAEVLARVKTGGKDINATIGLIAGAAPANSKAASETTTDSIIAQSAVSKDSFASYLNIPNILSLLDVVASIAPGETEKQQVEAAKMAFNSSLGAYSSMAVTSIFQNGFNGKSCSRFSGDGKAFEPFKAAIDSASDYKSSFYKLIGPRTTFAARVDGRFVGAGLKTMFNVFGSSGMAASPNSELAGFEANLTQQVKNAEEQISKLKIKDVGLIGNAPTTSFVPDVGIYFEHEAGVTIEQFGAALQELYKKLAPPSISESSPITISKDSLGQTQVVIPGMDGYQLAFKSISPTQILGSIQDSFVDEAKTLLAAKEPYVDDAKLASKGVNLKISDNDNFYYLSTSSLMPLVRQFAPFITMGKPELKISDTELTQFIDLFDFNLLAVGKNSSPENLLLCSSGQAVVY